MTFDAGSIEAKLDIDRTPFQQGLAAARKEAEEFARKRYKATISLDVDSKAARAAIERIRKELGMGGKTKLDIDVDTHGVDDKLQRTRREVDKLGSSWDHMGDRSALSFNMILDLITFVGPALVPLASGLAGISAALAPIGADAVLAIGGIKRAVEEGTVSGRKFEAMGKDLQGTLHTLQDTAAQGVLKPFQREVTSILASMPQLNQFIRDTSHQTGNILGKGADALLHLFQTAEPLMKSAEQSVSHMVTQLDHWAKQGGGEDFFKALSEDIPIAMETIGNLFTAVGDIVAEVRPLGHVMLEIINSSTGLIDVLDKVPGLITALATGWVAYRAASLLAGAGNALLVRTGLQVVETETAETIAMRANTLAAIANAEALGVLSVAQANLARTALAARGGVAASAGAGAAGAAGGLGAGAGTAASAGLLARGAKFALTKALPIGVASYIIGNTLGNALPKTETNPSSVGGGLTSLGTGASDVLSLHPLTGLPSAIGDLFSGNFGNIFGDLMPNSKSLVDNTNNELQRQVTQAWVTSQTPNMGPLGMFPVAPLPAGLQAGADATQALAQRRAAQAYNRSPYGQYAAGQSAANAQSLNQIGGMSDPTKIADANDQLTASLQDRIAAEQQLFDTSKGGITLTNGLTVSYAAYQKEMDATGQSLQETTMFFQAHSEALGNDQHTLEELSDRQQRYTKFLVDTSSKYGITSQQAALYTTALGLNYEKITASAEAERTSAKVLGEVQDAFTNGDTAMQGWLATISQVDLSTDTLNQRVSVLGAGLTALRGTQLDMAGVNLSTASSFEQAANTISQNIKSVGEDGRLMGQAVYTAAHGWAVYKPQLTEGSLQIQQSLAGAAQQAVGLAQTIYQNTGKVGQAFGAYKGFARQFGSTLRNETSLSDKAVQHLMKITFGPLTSDKHFVHLLAKDDVTGAIRNLTKKLGDFTKIIAKAIAGIDDDPFQTTYNKITGQLEILQDGVHVPVFIDQHGTGPVSGPKHGRATGGLITEGTTPTADDVPIWVSKGEAVIPANKTKENWPLISTWIKGYADGGTPGWTPPSLITDDGSGDGKGKGGKGGKGGSDGKAKEALGKLLDHFVSMLTSDVGDFGNLANESLKKVRRTLGDIADDLQKLYDKGYTSKASIHDFTQDTNDYIDTLTKLRAVDKQIAQDNRLLAKVKSERSTVVGGVLGQFDIATSGNGFGYGITADLLQGIHDTEKFQNLRRRAGKLGLDPRLLRQITEAGPEAGGANLEAIVHGGSSYVERLNRLYTRFRGDAGELGDTQTRDTYSATQARLTQKIHHEEERQTAIQKDLRTELRGLRKDVRVGIKTLKQAQRQNA